MSAERNEASPGGFASLPEPAIAPISGLRVLVVEDNVVNASLVRMLLEREGCVVSGASSGMQALDRLRTRVWDVVLMDCQMPDMDGYATTRHWRCQELAESRPRLPILALTAHTMDEDRDRCLDAGMDDYLTKPVKLNALRTMLSRYVSTNSSDAMLLSNAPSSTAPSRPIAASTEAAPNDTPSNSHGSTETHPVLPESTA